MLEQGGSFPHFEVTAIDGSPVSYDRLWQRWNLLLVTLPTGNGAEFDTYVSRLTARRPELAELNTVLVITRDVIRGVDAPGVVVADRWGEVCFTTAADRTSGLAEPDQLLEWLRYLQQQCPECEGESR